jgi:outer membrane beta-barrel protein
MRMRFILVLVALAIASTSAYADDDSDIKEQQRVVIQNRKFKLGTEVAFEGATLPLDPFNKGLGGTARLTFHFNDFNAWEVISATGAYNLNSDLANQLEKNFGIQAQQLPGLILMLESDYIVKPFYGKFALANRTLLYQEVYLAVGATASYWTDPNPLRQIRYGPNVGGGLRFFVADWLSWRFDLRYAAVASEIPFLIKNATLDGVLYLGTGLAFNIGG